VNIGEARLEGGDESESVQKGYGLRIRRRNDTGVSRNEVRFWGS
jgi:hypothetical protein